MILNKKCYASKEEYIRIKEIKKKKYFYIGIITLILGYSSIMDCFTFYEEGNDSFIIEKLISDRKGCRAKYMENDENLPEVEYSINPIENEIKDYRKKNYKKEENGNQIYEPLLYESILKI